MSDQTAPAQDGADKPMAPWPEVVALMPPGISKDALGLLFASQASFEIDREIGRIGDHGLEVRMLVAMKWSLLAAGAERLVQERELLLTVVRSQLDAKIREQYRMHPNVKVTEGAITSAIERDEDWIKANRLLAQAKAAGHLAKDMRGLLREVVVPPVMTVDPNRIDVDRLLNATQAQE